MSHFPFGAVVGEDVTKLALMLAAVAGVLLRGPDWPGSWLMTHPASVDAEDGPPTSA